MRERPVEKVLNEILDELIAAYLPSETSAVENVSARIGIQLVPTDDLATEARQRLKNQLAPPGAEKEQFSSYDAISDVIASYAGELHSKPATASLIGTERVLVVFDKEPVREAISSILSTAGYKTQQASSGMEALALLSTGEFELMLSELIMAELDGIGLLERSKEQYPDLPVIMVTGGQDVSVALAAIRNGAYDALIKPFKREQLLSMVRRALDHRRLKLENRAYQSNLESLVAARTEQLRESMTDLERSYDVTLEFLGGVLDLKDAEAEGHSKRVTAFAIAIARAMGVSGDKIRVIARGVFLHDIGKMSIPDSILRKPGALNDEEMQIMREHCFRGYEMLKRFPFLAEAAEIVYAHQERFDGTGYPRGLKGESIPLGARIFAIADTLAAITSDRPYRAAQSIAVAREEIKRFSGRQFDPEIVRVFMQMPDAIWEDLRKEIDSQIYQIGFFPDVQFEKEKQAKRP